MKIVFVDSTCPRSYDNEVLASSGLGGTEATVVRVATALSSTHDIVVTQHNRRSAAIESATLRFVPGADTAAHAARADHVVFLTKAQGLGSLVVPARGRVWLWIHNYLVDEVPFHWTDHLRHRLGVVCVSRTHADHTRAVFRRHPVNRLGLGFMARAGIVHHYDPIDAALAPDDAVVRDPEKLVFFSSPHKGIEHVVARFVEAHATVPALRLFVADPGYAKKRDPTLLEHPGIVVLGTLSQGEVLRHVREALCVFYPQFKRPETFGLVLAEANAVGTPVLAHDFGAAREILSSANPPIDASRPADVLRTILDWRAGRTPRVGPDPRFALSAVTDRWLAFLEDPDRFIAI